ncbi:diguanylate cyclase [Hydromonas duriensis]|uniref:VOC domain-containing protein n=1 Tax=Hydromonas duriensis TaxID=1527608 RepID=A0A4V3DJT6_9BURK|nr:diguanylate cyclase [Hydromonas duriensis]TDR31415.1 hypothetical protein DFR44_11063 [Hydromonas duriensis]
MCIIKFSHYNLRAHRALLEQLKDFYIDVVGLYEGERPPFKAFGYWLYAADQDVLHLTEAAIDESRPAHAQNTFDHIAFRATHRGEFETRLQQHFIFYTIENVPNSKHVQLFFKDPAGNGLEINFIE